MAGLPLTLVDGPGPLTLEYEGEVGVSGAPVDVDFDLTALTRRIRQDKFFEEYFELLIKALTSGVTDGPTVGITFLLDSQGVPETARVPLVVVAPTDRILVKATPVHTIVR